MTAVAAGQPEIELRRTPRVEEEGPGDGDPGCGPAARSHRRAHESRSPMRTMAGSQPPNRRRWCRSVRSRGAIRDFLARDRTLGECRRRARRCDRYSSSIRTNAWSSSTPADRARDGEGVRLPDSCAGLAARQGGIGEAKATVAEIGEPFDVRTAAPGMAVAADPNPYLSAYTLMALIRRATAGIPVAATCCASSAATQAARSTSKR